MTSAFCVLVLVQLAPAKASYPRHHDVHALKQKVTAYAQNEYCKRRQLHITVSKNQPRFRICIVFRGSPVPSCSFSVMEGFVFVGTAIVQRRTTTGGSTPNHPRRSGVEDGEE